MLLACIAPRSLVHVPFLAALTLAILAAGAGCATMAPRSEMATASVIVASPSAPVPLQRSLFARDPAGQLTEEALQKILSAPWEITLPARVGVLPIVPPADVRGPAPSSAVPPAAGELARALRGEHFTLVTEMMAIPSGALGMEALREVAARYRLRYLVLYREEIDQHHYANGWASLYSTLVGAFFVPGQTLRAAGYVEASLFDVKTGLLLATVRRPVFDEHVSTVWSQQEKLGAMAARLAHAEAAELARDLRAATTALATAAHEEIRQRAEQHTATADTARVMEVPRGAP